MTRIGPLQVDLASRELFLDGQLVRLGGRAFDILTVLIAAKGGLVSKDELLNQVWPDTIVEENNLQVHMSALRKMLGTHRELIQTVSGRGYRFVLRETSGIDADSLRESPLRESPLRESPLRESPPRETQPRESKSLDNKPRESMPRESMPRESMPSGMVERMPGHSIPNNLPANFQPLIGRDRAMRDLALTLASARLVTLIGSGGIGKTRLATEVARSLLAHFPDGVYLVSLASAEDAASVLAAFASSIGMSAASGQFTLARIRRELGEQRMLFVLDNCEQVLGPVAELAETLLNVNPALRILATSREPLRVVDESLYWVASLEVPGHDDQSEDVLQRSAVQLFLARARAMDARFSSDEHSIHLTGMVCRRLDGIPLAIELAAARAAILGIETLADHLDDRFNMLTGGNRTALPRHQTLKATLDWSHALLDDTERMTLRRLGVFVSSFTMEAAIAIAGGDALGEAEVIAAISGLVEKSLVVARMESSKASYRLLETTRAYAIQKLEDNAERRLVMLNHARYFASLVERDTASGTWTAQTDTDRWHQRMRDLLDDLRAALSWALSPKGDPVLGETLAVKVVALLYELSLVDECCAWARRALDIVAANHQGSSSGRYLRVRMQLLAALGSALVYVNGPTRETLGTWAEVLALAIALGESTFEARALWGMWNASQLSGAARNALAFAQRFASLAAETGDASNAVLADRLLGIASHYVGNQRQAQASIGQFLQRSDGLRHRLPLGRSIDQGLVGRATLARLRWLQGARDQALEIAAQCVAEACRQEQAIVTCYVLVEAEIPLALFAGKRARAAQAIALLQDVSARAGLGVSQACGRCFDEYLHSLDETGPARLAAFRAALDDLDALEYGASRAMLIAQYSLMLGRAGRREEGLATVVAALAQCDETGDHWYLVELRRVHGELLLMGYAGKPPPGNVATDAEACLSAAVDEALAQGCRSLQLRAATSLARLWHERGRSGEAVLLLQSACERLTEGLDWDDFEDATRLLRVVGASAAAPAQRAGHASSGRHVGEAARKPKPAWPGEVAGPFGEPPSEEIGERCPG
ncbi:winged helix-turn-helix domain-containing protein [Paraburkholderia sp. BCC1884]|uniref:winged helix-turn-helix domain-containing protein n=1 Tax=Paraburkholderia sp. BCC1884 TaxID=2562668 RepID=UPI00118349EE|nr:winged helix-turn-helix domain-containing protein [Paraburkholderia sp. BCC1884]